MKKHPIPIKRKLRRFRILFSAVLTAFVVMSAICASRIEESVALEYSSEETTLHDHNPTFIPLSFPTPKTAEPEASKSSVSDADIDIAAKSVWGEARGIDSETEQAAIVWCFLNRVDKTGRTLGEVVTEPYQFHYNDDFPTVDDNGRDLRELVIDVVSRWESEKAGKLDSGRVLPKEYIYFGGDGERNYFRTSYSSFDNIWDWGYPSPYDS